MLSALLWSLHAVAQPLPLELPGMQQLTIEPKGEARWVTTETQSLRFDGEQVPGPTFTAGEQVELILIDGDRARIRKDDRYGWVPTGALTTTAPAPPPLPLELPPLLPPPR